MARRLLTGVLPVLAAAVSDYVDGRRLPASLDALDPDWAAVEAILNPVPPLPASYQAGVLSLAPINYWRLGEVIADPVSFTTEAVDSVGGINLLCLDDASVGQEPSLLASDPAAHSLLPGPTGWQSNSSPSVWDAALSYCFWIGSLGAFGGWPYVFAWDNFSVGVYPTGTEFYFDGGGNWLGGPALQPGNHFVAVTVDGAGVARVHIDGQRVHIYDNEAPMGAGSLVFLRNTQALVSDVALFDVELSLAQVKWLFLAGSTP